MSKKAQTTVTGIHHINYVVKDLAASVAYFEKLLAQEAYFEELPLREVNTARFSLGHSYLVLVCPQNLDSEVGKILTERGEGLFLLSLSTNNLQEAQNHFADKNIAFSAKGSRKGLHDWLVADLDAPQSLGPVLQLCETQALPNSKL
jgi:methylmalonyl-CoA/ethylmalonyl-CoA epimerase